MFCLAEKRDFPNKESALSANNTATPLFYYSVSCVLDFRLCLTLSQCCQMVRGYYKSLFTLLVARIKRECDDHVQMYVSSMEVR
jgi:hypothetical protein